MKIEGLIPGAKRPELGSRCPRLAPTSDPRPSPGEPSQAWQCCTWAVWAAAAAGPGCAVQPARGGPGSGGPWAGSTPGRPGASGAGPPDGIRSPHLPPGSVSSGPPAAAGPAALPRGSAASCAPTAAAGLPASCSAAAAPCADASPRSASPLSSAASPPAAASGSLLAADPCPASAPSGCWAQGQPLQPPLGPAWGARCHQPPGPEPWPPSSLSPPLPCPQPAAAAPVPWALWEERRQGTPLSGGGLSPRCVSTDHQMPPDPRHACPPAPHKSAWAAWTQPKRSSWNCPPPAPLHPPAPAALSFPGLALSRSSQSVPPWGSAFKIYPQLLPPWIPASLPHRHSSYNGFRAVAHALPQAITATAHPCPVLLHRQPALMTLWGLGLLSWWTGIHHTQGTQGSWVPKATLPPADPYITLMWVFPSDTPDFIHIFVIYTYTMADTARTHSWTNFTDQTNFLQKAHYSPLELRGSRWPCSTMPGAILNC